MKSRVLFAILVAIVAMGSSRSWAQTPEALKKAQAAFDQAQTDYLGGKYDEAASGFQAAYAARPFPQFLYNVGASYHMKGKKTSDVPSYEKAVEFYKKYLQEEPTASDKPKVEKAISVLEAEIKRLKDLAAQAGAGSAAPPEAAPSEEVKNLGDVKVRGLVVIVTEPQNATIYLDDKKKGKFAETPWSGSIEGEHKVIIEKRGYKPLETTLAADPTKLVQLVTVMAQEDYLAWIEVTSNVPGASIYIDDQAIGAVGKTPLVPGQNIKPGKHTFWITSEGYDTYQETIDIAPGETKTIKATLRGAPVGKLSVTGLGIEDSRISIDGAVACEPGPCLKSVPEGSHTVEVTREGYKPYRRRLQITPKTETVIKVQMAQKPGRGDAIAAYIVAGIFGGGGIWAGTQAKNLKSELESDIDMGMPPVDNKDPRFLRGKIYSIAADGCFAISGIALLTGVYYTFRTKGPPTRALIDVRAVAVRPHVGPTYAGLGMEAKF